MHVTSCSVTAVRRARTPRQAALDDAVEALHRFRPRHGATASAPGRPRASRRRSAESSRTRRIASRVLARASCRRGNVLRPRRRRRPRPRGWSTTGTPIAIASRILFCVPRAMLSGATISADSPRIGPHVGHRTGDRHAGQSRRACAPRATDRPRRSSSLRPGRRVLQERQASARRSRTCIPGSGSSPCARRTTMRVGVVRRRGRREVVAIHAVREPVGRRAGAVALERLPLRRASSPCRGRTAARGAAPRARASSPSSQ